MLRYWVGCQNSEVADRQLEEILRLEVTEIKRGIICGLKSEKTTFAHRVGGRKAIGTVLCFSSFIVVCKGHEKQLEIKNICIPGPSLYTDLISELHSAP